MLKHDIPLDFYSWHMYADTPFQIYEASKNVWSEKLAKVKNERDKSISELQSQIEIEFSPVVAKELSINLVRMDYT